MWLIHRGNRYKIHNTDKCKAISMEDKTIILEYVGSNTPLIFETKIQATQAFKYLLEAIKRNDKLVNL